MSDTTNEERPVWLVMWEEIGGPRSGVEGAFESELDARKCASRSNEKFKHLVFKVEELIVTPKRETELSIAHGSAEHRAQLWDAINEYAEACGGTPGERIYGNTKRQQAVSDIEALVYPPNSSSNVDAQLPMSDHTIEGQRLTVLISNAHRLLGRRYRRAPLWSLVSDLTGNGSTTSSELCRAAGYDPSQPCGKKYLKGASSNNQQASQ